eukprot:1234083-Pyramimonas_sp.AAC.1
MRKQSVSSGEGLVYLDYFSILVRWALSTPLLAQCPRGGGLVWRDGRRRGGAGRQGLPCLSRRPC